jgi:hypothetical protein
LRVQHIGPVEESQRQGARFRSRLDAQLLAADAYRAGACQHVGVGGVVPHGRVTTRHGRRNGNEIERGMAWRQAEQEPDAGGRRQRLAAFVDLDEHMEPSVALAGHRMCASQGTLGGRRYDEGDRIARTAMKGMAHLNRPERSKADRRHVSARAQPSRSS